MTLTENLTKENFWDDIFSRYPEQCKIFCDWIDEYKDANNWNTLFNHGVEFQEDMVYKTTQAPKFHDLPYAMQMGIWFEFVTNQGGCSFEIDVFDFDLRLDIEEYFQHTLSDFIASQKG